MRTTPITVIPTGFNQATPAMQSVLTNAVGGAARRGLRRAGKRIARKLVSRKTRKRVKRVVRAVKRARRTARLVKGSVAARRHMARLRRMRR